MKLETSAKFAFISMGVAALNMGLMASGIETMPHMWLPEVYQDHTLGACIGGMTGIALGGTAAAAVIVTEEAIKSTISVLREKFTQSNNKSKLAI